MEGLSPFAIWHRSSRRSRWQLVATAPTRDAALEKVKGAGDWYVGAAGVDPNGRRPPAARVPAPGT